MKHKDEAQMNSVYTCEECGVQIVSAVTSQEFTCHSCGHVNKSKPAIVRPAVASPDRAEAKENLCGTAQTADTSTTEDSTVKIVCDSKALLSHPHQIVTVRSAAELESVLNAPEPNVNVLPDGSCVPMADRAEELARHCENLRNALSKLESQVCRDPELPQAYRTILNQAWTSMEAVEALLRSRMAERHKNWENVGYELRRRIWAYQEAHNEDRPGYVELGQMAKEAYEVSAWLPSAPDTEEKA